MYVYIYAEVDIICILLSAFMFWRAKRISGSALETWTLRCGVWVNMLLLAADLVWVLGEGGVFPLSRAANVVTNTVYMFLTGILACLFLLFVLLRIGGIRLSRRKFWILLWTPAAVLCILSVASAWTGWIFYVTEEGVYHRGRLYVLQPVLTYVYLAVGLLCMLVYAGREKNPAKRRELYMMMTYMLLPIVGGICQILLFGLPLVLMSTTVSQLVLLVNLLEAQISRDSLTGLNNRRRAQDYLHERLTGLGHRTVYFLLGDLDSFKQINDQYGHPEGDRALIAAAEAMKRACQGHHALLARYGGDEFCIVSEPLDGQGPEELSREINIQMETIRRERKLPYGLSITFGWARCDREGESIASVISRADRMLYENKAQRHLGKE